MDLPLDIKEKIESLLSGYKLDILKSRVSTLSKRYKEESGEGFDLIKDELDALIYASFRMPATYKAVYESLSYTLEFYKEDINSVIDVGAGTGASSIAAYNLLNIDNITLLERSIEMQKVGKELVPPSFKYRSFDLTKDELSDSGDLLIASYIFNELKKEEILLAVDKLWDKTNKVLLIVEPGTKEGYSNILKLRNHLIKNGGYLISPCPHMNDCPLAKDDWCHFSSRVNRSKLHKLIKSGDAPYEDEKYSYIAFSKTPIDRCSFRVLRHPYISKGYVSINMCSKNGLENIKVTKSDKSNYKRAHKLKAGDSYYFE